MTHRGLRLRRPTRGIAAAAALLVWFGARPALGQTPTAAGLFERARAAEQQLGESASADALRRAARDYETIVLRFPNNGYCDNALWQAATLFERAWNRSADSRDRDDAIKAYAWLAREYPASALVRQSQARAAALKASPAPGAPPAPASGPPAVKAPAPAERPASTPQVVLRSISRADLPHGDRVTIELNSEVSYLRERVPNPDRVFFDFANAAVAASLLDQARALQSPLIKGVRVGTPTPGVTRVVIELTGAPRFSVYSLYAPFRVVIDLDAAAVPAPAPASTPTPAPAAVVPSPKASPPVAPPASSPRPSPPPASSATPTPAPSTPPPAPSPAPSASPSPTTTPAPAEPPPAAPSSTGRGDYSLARQLGLRVAKIVIDPGHGGHDPGAISNGVTEAELVLDVALRLEKLLESIPGVEVVLTRRGNEFVPLEERTAIANREHADLFLSIHANSHRQPAVSGIETYFLNFATNPDAESVAARENAASVQTMGTLPAIVKAIALNNKIEESREFATVLQAALVRRLRTPAGGGRDLGVKQAPFVVLIGAQMPSVLTEIGFLTNKAEADGFKQQAQRQSIAQALRDAVVRYQDSLKRVSTSGSLPR